MNMERDIAFLTRLLADHLLATEMPIPTAILKPRQSLEGENPDILENAGTLP